MVGEVGPVPSNLAAAVFGRASISTGTWCCSLAGGLGAEIGRDVYYRFAAESTCDFHNRDVILLTKTSRGFGDGVNIWTTAKELSSSVETKDLPGAALSFQDPIGVERKIIAFLELKVADGKVGFGNDSQGK